MKKVLHRSFKPAKCKISLQMATSRLKILKNKKDSQIKQLRRELAQLLETGQTQTAKIRVEHVVREEKTVAAYELVGIYCELLVARLGVIDSQKTCPVDLKESVSSVLYASQRLSDVAELADIVKHFSAKYGKDFVSAAIGLQPDSGVSRLLVDKLSVKAPDGPTKIKILTEIAREHNVTWEAESLAESDPKETVLFSGASSSQPVSGVKSESSRIPSSQPPASQAPPTVNVSQTSYANDGRSSSHNASTYHQDPRPSVGRSDDREHRPPNPTYEDSSPWETEFADATTAARAAAESAERASFAARAAAELSRKERMMKSMQNTTISRNEPSHRPSSSSNKEGGGFAKEEMLRSSDRQEDQPTLKKESYKENVDELSENDSWRSSHSRDNSFEMSPDKSFAEIGREKKQPSMDAINLSYQEEALLNKQSSRASSPSPSSHYSDDNDVTATDHIDSPSILADNIFHSTFKDTESHDHGPYVVVAPAFDDYSSFFDKPQFDTEDSYRDEPEQGLEFSLLGGSSKTPEHMHTETNSWSFKEHESLGQPSSTSTSPVLEKEKPSPPLFNDGPSSPPAALHESEPSAKFDDNDQDYESEEENLRSKGKLSGHVEEKPKLTSHKSLVSDVPDDLGRYFFPSDTEDDPKTQEESDSETPTDLSFGPLAGELKIEETHPPYGMSPPRDKTLSESVNEDVQTETDPPRSSSQKVTPSSSRKDLTHKTSNPNEIPSYIPPDSSSSDDETEMELRKRVSNRNKDKRTESRTRHSHLQSRVSHEDPEEEIPTRPSIRSQEKRTQKTTPASSASYFHSMSSEDEDEDEKEVRRGNVPIQTKPSISISRRTKGQERRSSLVIAKADKDTHDQESLPKLIHGAKQQESAASSSSLLKSDKASHDQESHPKLTPKAKPLANQHGSSSSSSSLPKTNKVSHYQESPAKLSVEAKLQAKQEGSTSSSSSFPTNVISPDPETPAKEKASHVHPKLPDYDDIFARLGAHRR
ncbi:unnamed protein product [Cochlearia groenlandica]